MFVRISSLFLPQCDSHNSNKSQFPGLDILGQNIPSLNLPPCHSYQHQLFSNEFLPFSLFVSRNSGSIDHRSDYHLDQKNLKWKKKFKILHFECFPSSCVQPKPTTTTSSSSRQSTPEVAGEDRREQAGEHGQLAHTLRWQQIVSEAHCPHNWSSRH